MRRFLVELEFNGKNYGGWQIQPNVKTIEGETETALYKLFGEKITAYGCSRTDSGVSAESYYFHFDCDTKLPYERVCFKLNRFLPKDIQAQSSKEVPLTFSAKDNVKSKTYDYLCYVSPHIKPLLNRDRERIEKVPDIEAMKKACEYLTGRHDFSAFRNSSPENVSATRMINFINITFENGFLTFSYNGDGFLYNMIRILTGTLLDVGAGKYPPENVKEILDGKNREKAGMTMPPKSLILKKVNY